MHLSAMFQSPSNNTCTLKSLLCRQNPAGVFYLFPSSAWASSTLWQSLLTPARHVRCTPVASPLAPQCLTCVPTFPGNTAILTSYRHQSISTPGPSTACTLHIPSPEKNLENSIPHLPPESPLQCSPNLSPHVYPHAHDLYTLLTYQR